MHIDRHYLVTAVDIFIILLLILIIAIIILIIIIIIIIILIIITIIYPSHSVYCQGGHEVHRRRVCHLQGSGYPTIVRPLLSGQVPQAPAGPDAHRYIIIIIFIIIFRVRATSC